MTIISMPAQAQSFFSRRAGVALFAALLAYFTPWIFQGLDMTDEGHHVASQFMFMQGRPDYPFGMLLWLTHGIGGAWLSLWGGSLLAARTAWVLTMSLTGLAAFRILARHVPRGPAALAVAAGAVACMHHGNMVLNQNNFPFLLLLTGAGLLLESDCAQAAARRRGFALAAGAVLGLAVMARFPLVVGLGLVAVPPAARSIHARRMRPESWLAAGWALLGAAAAIGAALAGLAAAGYLGTYARSLSGAGFKEEYSAASLLGVYRDSSRHALRAVMEALLEAVPWAIGLHFLCRWARRGRWAPPLLGAIGLLWIGATARRVGISAFHWEYFHLLPGLCFLAGAALFFLTAWRGAKDEATTRRQVMLAVALALPVLIMAGTNNGILNMTHGLWLLFPAVALLTPDAVARLAPTREGARRSAAAYAAVVAATLALVGASFRFVNSYRDTRARWTMTARIDAPRLRGIYTTPRRAASLGGLFGELAKRTRVGDCALVCGGAPMVHFVSGTVSALDNAWPECLGIMELKRRLSVMRERGPRPVVVVRAVTDMASRRWGGDPAVRPARTGMERAREEAMDEAVQAMGYRPVWTNADFVILTPPAGGKENAAAIPAGASAARTETPAD